MIAVLGGISQRFLCQKVVFKAASASAIDSFKFDRLRLEMIPESKRRPKPPASSLGFGSHFTDHFLKIEYNKRDGWSDPEIIPLESFSLHPASKVFQYAQSIFEGMKAYRGDDDKIRLFRPEENMQRMLRSCQRATLPLYDSNELIKCIKKLVQVESSWVPKEEMTSLYIRPCHIGVDPTLGVSPAMESILYVLACPSGPYFKIGKKPVSLFADPRFVRAWPGGAGHFKMSSNYAPTLHVQRIAEKNGHQQVLWLYNDDHQITEVGNMNVFVYLINESGEKELITPPISDEIILPGVTRSSVLALTREWNEFKVSERRITMSEVVKAIESGRLLEMFGTGTACAICPIGNINYDGKDYRIPTIESEDQLNQKVLKFLTDIHYGRVNYKDWAHVI